MTFTNGETSQTIWGQKLPTGWWAFASIVSVRFHDGAQGVTFEFIDKAFDKEQLKVDETWQELSKRPRLEADLLDR